MEPKEPVMKAGIEPAVMVGGARTKPANHVDMQNKGAPEYAVSWSSLELDRSPFSWVVKVLQKL